MEGPKTTAHEERESRRLANQARAREDGAENSSGMSWGGNGTADQAGQDGEEVSVCIIHPHPFPRHGGATGRGYGLWCAAQVPDSHRPFPAPFEFTLPITHAVPRPRA